MLILSFPEKKDSCKLCLFMVHSVVKIVCKMGRGIVGFFGKAESSCLSRHICRSITQYKTENQCNQTHEALHKNIHSTSHNFRSFLFVVYCNDGKNMLYSF